MTNNIEVIKVFADTSIINRILDIRITRPKDCRWEEDRQYLYRLQQDYIKKGVVNLTVNPSIKLEIEKTADPQRRKQLLALFNKFHFISYNKTIFPFRFPAHFVTGEEKSDLKELCRKSRGFKKDEKIFLDAVSSRCVEVLLTTDRKHLTTKETRNYLKDKGLDKVVKIMKPKELYEYLQNRFLLPSSN